MDPSEAELAPDAFPSLPEGVVTKALGPAAQEFGKELAPAGKALGEVIARTTMLALSPVKGVIWGAESIKSWIEEKVAPKIAHLPSNSISEPSLRIAGPTIEAIRFSGEDEEVSELFANLLANSMINENQSIVHPAFVEVVKQMSPLDARIVKYISDHEMVAYINVRQIEQDGYKVVATYFSQMWVDLVHPNNYRTSIDNLIRLALISSPPDVFLAEKSAYEFLERHKAIEVSLQQIASSKRKAEFDRRILQLTEFGKCFVKVTLSVS